MKSDEWQQSESLQYLYTMIDKQTMDQAHTLLGEGLSGKIYNYDSYAVKVFKEDYSEKEDFMILNQLQQHPGFPTLHYYDDQMMVVEKIEGVTWATLCQNNEPLDDTYFQQITEMVEDCYKEGIVVDDLHLNNLMIDKQKQVKIVDVGRFMMTDSPHLYKEKIETDLETLQQNCGFLGGFFGGSSSRKKRKRKYSSSSRRKGYRYDSSSRKKSYRYDSSDPRRYDRRRYSSSDRYYRRKKYSS